MQLIIHNKENYNKEFVKDFLLKHITNFIMTDYKLNKIKYARFEEILGYDLLNLFKFILDNLKVVETPLSYVISIDNVLYYKGKSITLLVNFITYGTRTCQGNTIFLKAFNYIAKNIDILYKEWLDGD